MMAGAEVSVVDGEANLSRRVEARSTNDVVLVEPRVRNRCTRFPRNDPSAPCSEGLERPTF